MSDSSPVCFRVPAEERHLLAAIASYQGLNLSTFVRDTVRAVSRGIVDREGRDQILRQFEETAEARKSRQSRHIAFLDDIVRRSADPSDDTERIGDGDATPGRRGGPRG